MEGLLSTGPTSSSFLLLTQALALMVGPFANYSEGVVKICLINMWNDGIVQNGIAQFSYT